MGTMMLYIAITMFLSKFAQAAVSLSNGMTFDTTLIGTTKIQFTIITSSTGWVGFSFGTCMCTNDVFVIQATGGAGTITDRTMSGHSSPSLDVVNDYTLSTSTSGSTNTYTVTRLLNDGDSGDYQFTSGTHNIVYAWGTGSMSYHNANRGSFSISISISSSSSGSGVTTSSSGVITIDDGNTKKHGILQYIAWGWLCFFMIVTGRYMKFFYFINTLLHLIFGITIFIITLVAAFSIDDITKSSETGSFLGKSHKSLGLALVYLMITIVSIGITSKLSMLCCRHLTLWIKLIKIIHAVMGYLVIIYSQYVVLTGLYTFQASVRALYFVQMAVILLCFAIIEVSYCLINRKYYKAIINVKRKGLKSMSIKEFYESKRKLALFNDYVVDLTTYAFDHPGGKYVIQQCNKKDIGKYLYGAYSMENNVSPHKHSLIAMKIVERLICARIMSNSELMQEFDSNRSVAMFIENPNLVEAGVYNTRQISIYKVANVEEISKNFHRVTFNDNEAKENIQFSKGLDSICKHYAVVSLKDQIARYYTVCQSFNSKFYQQYIDAFDSVLTGKEYTRSFESIEQITNETSSSIELFMKFYLQSKNGITKKISYSTNEDRFIISGTFGKGLNLDIRNITGSNIIIVGGTGILPFIDLFAYLARRLINKRAEIYQVFLRETFDSSFSEAKFIVYAYYPDKSNAVGMEFCEKISNLFQHFGVEDEFKFVPQFSRSGDKKLSTLEDILTFLKGFKSKESLKNIFVCGPPPMNNLFQRYKSKIQDELSLEEHQIEII